MTHFLFIIITEEGEYIYIEDEGYKKNHKTEYYF